jgi:hypothetical protein
MAKNMENLRLLIRHPSLGESGGRISGNTACDAEEAAKKSLPLHQIGYRWLGNAS